MHTAHRIGRRSLLAVLLVLTFGVFSVLPAASAGTSSGHIEHFLLLSTGENADPAIIAHGPIHAKGVDHALSDTQDKFAFARGALWVTHAMTTSHDTYDPKTCYATYRESGTYQITGGTQAYRHAHGFGKYSLNVTVVGCDQNSPEVFIFHLNASGPLWK